MTVMVTGGAGFIGRWVVKNLLHKGYDVVVIDNLSNGRKENLAEFEDEHQFKEFIINDIRNKKVVDELFEKYNFNICFHWTSFTTRSYQ